MDNETIFFIVAGLVFFLCMLADDMGRAWLAFGAFAIFFGGFALIGATLFRALYLVLEREGLLLW